jgi:hypothetical protein
MQDDHVACLHLRGDQSVSVLPPLHICVLFSGTERRT